MRRLLLFTAVALGVALTVPPTAGAHPTFDPDAGDATPVFPGIVRTEYAFSLGQSPEIANVVTFGATDPLLELRPVLGQDEVAGLESVPSMGARLLDDGFVAGLNGGFWLSDPLGEPNGYLAVDGRLVSNAETQGAGPRGTFALREDGMALVDRIDTDVRFIGAGADRDLVVQGVNRGLRTSGDKADPEEATLVYTEDYDSPIEVRPRRVPESSPSPSPSPDGEPQSPPPTRELPVRTLVVDGLYPRAAGVEDGVVVEVRDGATTVEVPDAAVVVVAHGPAAEALAGAQAGDKAGLLVDIDTGVTDPEDWHSVRMGVAAGPLIVRGGVRVPPEEWEDEGFAPQVHSIPRAPRSAIGITAEGVVIMAAVDGRQPGVASGMTIAELADFMLELGAVDALSLDGGGSSQVVQDGLLRNAPCCDEQVRAVSNGLFIRHSYTYTATSRLAGGNRLETAVAVAAASHPDGADEVVLANAGGFADALAGGPLAVAREAPLLLTGPEELAGETRAELARLDPQTVTVLGGTAAIAAEVTDELRDEGYAVRRLAGADRTETAAEIARALGRRHERVFLASAGDFPDALTAAAPAGISGAPVLLTGRAELAEEAAEVLDDARTEEVIVAGGPRAISEDVTDELDDDGFDVIRLAGADRYGTARALNAWAEEELTCAGPVEPLIDGDCVDRRLLVVARGDAFPDALTGGPYAASWHSLLMIVPGEDVRAASDAEAYLESRRGVVERIVLLGGHAGLSSYEQWQLDGLAESGS